MQRKIGMKSIQYEENLDGRTADTRWRYNMALPQKDTEDKHRKNTKKGIYMSLVHTDSTLRVKPVLLS